jgi:molybdopterin molybdotransferase
MIPRKFTLLLLFFSIVAALLEGRMEPAFLHHVTEDETAIATAIDRALCTCDIVLITGGVSVGDFDFVSSASKSQ